MRYRRSSIKCNSLIYTHNSWIYYMLNTFNNKQNSVYNNPLYTPPIIEKSIIEKNKTISYSEKNEYNKMIYYPFSSKEWFSSIYSYNKSFIKSLISKEAVLNKLFRSYSNMLPSKKKIFFKRRRDNKIRYSAKKIFLSNAELEHTNIKLFITFSIFNKQIISIKRFIRKIITWIIKKSINKKKVIIPKHKNRLLHLLKNNFFIFRKWKIFFFRSINPLKKYLLIKLRSKHIKSYKVSRYNIKFLKKILNLEKKFFELMKWMNFNKFKFNSLSLNSNSLGVISLINKLYDKETVIKLIDLKTISLNSDVFSSAVALKLRDRKNKAVRILRKAILQMVRIPDLHTLITFDDKSEIMNKNNIISTIKQQIVSGVRFEASGRLTRRLTAMRAVFKYRYVGSLNNIRSSFNNKSSTMLRGNVKSNLQYTLISSKTRNGTFGLKGWVSSH
uniref:Small ribosomal subunit protein uS3m n=1 Tax=Coniothyrium glycines TaxID=1077358 RepID=A0A3G4S6P7_9PLEO|nr:ribosomal protein S3 [Coniothyrium glycines]AYU74392.1 ribosomal protein S3 [Coniothyrium glycines]